MIAGYGTSKLVLPQNIYLVMYGAAVIWHGTCEHGQLPRVPLGVTYVITGCVMGMWSEAGLM